MRFNSLATNYLDEGRAVAIADKKSVNDSSFSILL